MQLQDASCNAGEKAPAKSELRKDPMTNLEMFWMLTKFMLPLVATQMVPDVAEQALNRGITSIASSEMTTLLASFGLAFYVTKLFSANSMEVRNISIVLVHSKTDYYRMLILSTIIGGVLSALLLIISLTPLGTWFIRDLHRQTQEVSDLTCSVISYLSPIPLLEAVAYYHEGALIYQKLTMYAGLAKLVDCAMQILFIIVLLFTPTRTDPLLIPIFALYAGVIGRLILDTGFWYVLVRRKLTLTHDTEKAAKFSKGLLFIFPLCVVRTVQVVSRPIINLVVSRTLAEKAGKAAAAQAIAVLTVVYPTGRLVFSWLNDLRTLTPTFHKKTKEHDKFSVRILMWYSAFCTLVVFLLNLTLFMIPGVAFFIMNTIVGVSEELAQLSLLPLKIFSGLCICVGIRAALTGFLIMKKKTMYLTPSAVCRLLGLILFLATLSYTKLNGAVLGITCLLLGFAVEFIVVGLAVIVVRCKPDLDLTACFKCKKRSQPIDDLTPEAQPLQTNDQEETTTNI